MQYGKSDQSCSFWLIQGAIHKHCCQLCLEHHCGFFFLIMLPPHRSDISVPLPFVVESHSPNGQRTAIICVKDRPTPRKYPRDPGTPAKLPL